MKSKLKLLAVLAAAASSGFYAQAEEVPAYSETIQCNFKKSSNNFEGDCWIPNQVNDLAVNFDGLKKGYKKSFFPDRRVNARVFPSSEGWTGKMQGRKVEDPTRFELVLNDKGNLEFGKLPFGWFNVLSSTVNEKKMSIVFDVSHQVKPTNVDIKIVQRAKEILSSPAIWNRKDTRQCPDNASQYSIFCAMMKAAGDITGNIHYRQPAMQAFRETINVVGRGRFDKHRIQDWNNHPDTTFAEVVELFDLTEQNLKNRVGK